MPRPSRGSVARTVCVTWPCWIRGSRASGELRQRIALCRPGGSGDRLPVLTYARTILFVNANKRAALGACIVFLRLNGVEPNADGPEWEELTLAIAADRLDRDEATMRLRTLLPPGF